MVTSPQSTQDREDQEYEEGDQSYEEGQRSTYDYDQDCQEHDDQDQDCRDMTIKKEVKTCLKKKMTMTTKTTMTIPTI